MMEAARWLVAFVVFVKAGGGLLCRLLYTGVRTTTHQEPEMAPIPFGIL
jgi:hypothetical protein